MSEVMQAFVEVEYINTAKETSAQHMQLVVKHSAAFVTET